MGRLGRYSSIQANKRFLFGGAKFIKNRTSNPQTNITIFDGISDDRNFSFFLTGPAGGRRSGLSDSSYNFLYQESLNI